MPPEPERAERLRVVLHVLYLIFNEGYIASSGPDLQRSELTREAIRLTRAVHALLPDDGEVAGLLALMLLTDARRPARTRADGTLIALAEQDRGLWNRADIEEGTALITDALAHATLGPYQLQAAIAAVHDEAPARAGHRLAADPRPLRAARARRAQPDGHPQPRRRGGDGQRARAPASSCWPRSTPTTGWPPTTASTPSAPICWRWPATTPRPAPATATAARRTTSLPEQRYLEARAARLLHGAARTPSA